MRTARTGFDPYLAFGRTTDAGIVEYFDRPAIEQGALAGRGLEIAWLEDKVDVFFIHVQGAARLNMTDGRPRRITYAAKSGQRFTGPGRILAELGEIPLAEVTMQSIRRWFRDHPDRIDEILWQNRSFIFFRDAPVDDAALGPVAAAKVPLTPGRSIAVDRLLHTFGTPFYIDAPSLTAFRQKPVSPPDDRAGYRFGDHRGGARRPFRRIGRGGRRDRRRRTASGRFLRAGAAPSAWRAGRMSKGERQAQRRGPHHLDQGGAHGEAVEGQSRHSPPSEPQADSTDAMAATACRAVPAAPPPVEPKRPERKAKAGPHPFDQQTRDKLSRAACRSTPASTCMA